jgi:hypothetical protein
MMATMPQAAWDLAQRAADHLTGTHAHPDVARGVLAQWIAEHGYQWPFSRNNPGNLAHGWAAVFPYPFSVQTPNPQPGNPIVTFARQEGGADCYAAGLTSFSRYAPAVHQARLGLGLDFAVLVCRAGYGTRESTVRVVYATLQRPASPVPAPAPGGSDVAIRYVQVAATPERMTLRAGQPLYAHPGGPAVSRMLAAGSVPYVGQAASVGGVAWRAVICGTVWSYSDGRRHRTVLYVPASAGEVSPA